MLGRRIEADGARVHSHNVCYIYLLSIEFPMPSNIWAQRSIPCPAYSFAAKSIHVYNLALMRHFQALVTRSRFRMPDSQSANP